MYNHMLTIEFSSRKCFKKKLYFLNQEVNFIAVYPLYKHFFMQCVSALHYRHNNAKISDKTQSVNA